MNITPEWYICYDEPTLMHYYHPKSIIYIKVHSWLVYHDMYPHYNTIQNSLTALKVLCVPTHDREPRLFIRVERRYPAPLSLW